MLGSGEGGRRVVGGEDGFSREGIPGGGPPVGGVARGEKGLGAACQGTNWKGAREGVMARRCSEGSANAEAS